MRYPSTPSFGLLAATGRCTLLLMAGLLAACGSDGNQPAADTEAAAAPQYSIASQALAAETIANSTVPVTIAYEFLAAPAVGDPLTVRLSVTSRDVSELSMALSVRGQIALSNNMPATIALNSATPDAQPERYDAVVNVTGEGRSILNVQVTGVYDGQSFTKAISIPVQVGRGGPVRTSNGEFIDDGVEVLSPMPAAQQVNEPASKP